MDPKPFSVAIVGGGIGGIALAIGLLRYVSTKHHPWGCSTFPELFYSEVSQSTAYLQ